MLAPNKQPLTPAKRKHPRFRRLVRFRALNTARYCVDLIKVRAPREPIAARKGVTRIALVSDDGAYCSEQQFHPFSHYRSDLRSKLGVVSLHMLIGDVLRAPALFLRHFDIIALKISYRTAASDALRITQTIRSAVPAKPLVYFDGDDDVCVQWPEIMPLVDLYVKKHVFRNRNDYLKRYTGKSNLHDYAHRVHGYVFNPLDYGNADDEPLIITGAGPVAADQLDKIHLSYSLTLDQIIQDLYDRLKGRVIPTERQIDIHFRGAVKPETFTRYFRGPVAAIVSNLEPACRSVMSSTPIPPNEYYDELLNSKICISPFGFGEVCRRDFEAVLCGCLLVKQDMSHMQTLPDTFVPYETYVPV
jgi:hypothetical protein